MEARNDIQALMDQIRELTGWTTYDNVADTLTDVEELAAQLRSFAGALDTQADRLVDDNGEPFAEWSQVEHA